jgi:hypothetical protein
MDVDKVLQEYSAAIQINVWIYGTLSTTSAADLKPVAIVARREEKRGPPLCRYWGKTL